MVTIYNRLSQPISIGESVLPADGSMELEHSSAELKRLEDNGSIAIVRHQSETEAPKEKEGNDKSAKGDKK